MPLSQLGGDGGSVGVRKKEGVVLEKRPSRRGGLCRSRLWS